MTTEEKWIAEAFQKCKERGWIAELVPSEITQEEIAEFEQQHQIKLPAFYKAFLTSYQLPPLFDINGIISSFDELSPQWLMLESISEMSELSENMSIFQEDAIEYRAASAESCKQLIPIGDWGAGWGPLCIDLSKEEALIDPDNPSTWSLTWFDHEEFDWNSEEDVLLHGSPAAPDLKTLLEWYFCGALEPAFEEENQVKVTFDRLNNMDFCCSYWEDRWKD